ncbi:MAG: hypothetical protein H0W83_00815, partial [Planctomycetes bacterium]|nr:hypothetical protein [Planctomycetota bacterium]
PQTPAITAAPLPAPDLTAPLWLTRADPLADEARRLGNDCRRVGLFLAARLPSAPLPAR